MKTHNRIIGVLAIMAMVLVPFTPAYAANSLDSNSSGSKIKLDNIYVNTEYKSENIIVDRSKTQNGIEVTVKDKMTGKVLDVWGEKKIKSTQISPDYVGTMDRLIYHDKTVGPIKTRLNAVLELYQYDSFVQINRVKEMYWEEMSSGNWNIQNGHTDSHMKSTPGTSVDLSGTATAVITTTTSTTGSFSISALQQLGFTLQNSSGSTYYARKHLTDNFSYSVM